MKIVSWNCSGGLRKKLKELDGLNADLLMIHECENPEHYQRLFEGFADDYIWVGDNKNKGVAIFARNGTKISKLKWEGSFSIQGLNRAHHTQTWSTSDLKYLVPIRVNDQYTIVAVWTKGDRDLTFSYIGQLWKFIQLHDNELSLPGTMLIGDLNSNTRWDKDDRWWSHSGVVSELEQLNLHSLYHHITGEAQGHETIPTYFMYRRADKPYHIDYAFVSGDMIEHCNIEIGNRQDWLHCSDHVPLVVTIS